LNESFAWLGTPAAIIMLTTAAIAEIAAFYIPGVDNLLNALAMPGSVLAGVWAFKGLSAFRVKTTIATTTSGWCSVRRRLLAQMRSAAMSAIAPLSGDKRK
jgi:Domain of unknown function (DUF4126)